jgi:chromosome segregation ATPase
MNSIYKNLLDTFFKLKYSITRSPAVSKDEKVVFARQIDECEDSVRQLAALADSLDRTMSQLDAQLQRYNVENGDLKSELDKSGDFVGFLLDKNRKLQEELNRESREASDYRYNYNVTMKENLKLKREIDILKLDLSFKKLERK